MAEQEEDVAVAAAAHGDESNNDPLDDIFGSAPASPTTSAATTASRSEYRTLGYPRLRRTHVTNGYRDGVAESKARFVQDGFDEGYGLGAVLGLRAGWCLGVLEGCVAGVEAAEEGKAREGGGGEELGLRGLFGETYFGEDGVWKFEVEGKEAEGREGEVTFREVARCHPLLVKWMEVVRKWAEGLGVDLDTKRFPEGTRVDYAQV
ncbi:Essential protein Yae1, N terminal [Taxawa tesnikishii (nom. ined.)]|nr:Essential protein Yae1, N terminal [Dothideales sp. JES 119]